MRLWGSILCFTLYRLCVYDQSSCSFHARTGGGQKKVAICQTSDMVIFIFNLVILQG